MLPNYTPDVISNTPAVKEEEPRGLTDYSEKDRPWDTHRGHADDLAGLYALTEFQRYSERISACSEVLRFAWADDTQTGESRLKLREAQFCRVRHCPVCQWRRALMWQARFYQALPRIMQDHPRTRWLFLTLTVRNCPLEDLRATITAMNKAWQRLIKRPEFKPVVGWVRTTEVTRGQDGSAHPHFHVLLMVQPSMASGVNYVTHGRWVALWRETMRLDYDPSVRIKAVKKINPEAVDSAPENMRRAVAETLKYSVKASDLIEDEDWTLEFTRQVHKLRFIATGGLLRSLLKDDQGETDEQMIHVDAEAEAGKEDDDGVRVGFKWRTAGRRYRRHTPSDV